MGLAHTYTDASVAVADDHKRSQRKPAAALDNLGYTVDIDDALLEFRGGCFPASFFTSHCSHPPLKLQSGAACAICQCFHTAVVEVPTAVEHDLCDTCIHGTFADVLAYNGGAGDGRRLLA